MKTCEFCPSPVVNEVCANGHPQPKRDFPMTLKPLTRGSLVTTPSVQDKPAAVARSVSAKELLTRSMQLSAPEVGVVLFNSTAWVEVQPTTLDGVPAQASVRCGGETGYNAALSAALGVRPTAIVFMSDGENNMGSYDAALSQLQGVSRACVAFGPSANRGELSKIASHADWVFDAAKVTGELPRVLAKTTTMLSRMGDSPQGRRLLLVLDVSGSMASWKAELELAYSHTIAELRKLWKFA